jgi:hypothetical protein
VIFIALVEFVVGTLDIWMELGDIQLHGASSLLGF